MTTINLDKTLSQLDKQEWGAPPDSTTTLVKKLYLLRKKPLRQFTTEDLRLLIGQNCNLDILIPLALDRLTENILAEGDFYEGDLLNSVLHSDINYWTKNKSQWQTVKKLYTDSRQIFESDNIHRQTRKSFERFDKIHNH